MDCSAKARDDVWNNEHFCTLPAGHTVDHDCLCGYTWPAISASAALLAEGPDDSERVTVADDHQVDGAVTEDGAVTQVRHGDGAVLNVYQQ